MGLKSLINSNDGLRYSLVLFERIGREQNYKIQITSVIFVRIPIMYIYSGIHYLRDKHYGDFLTIWNELTQTAEHEPGYSTEIGNTVSLVTPAASIPAANLRVPFQFWFCRNAGLALPLIALQLTCQIVGKSIAPIENTYKIGKKAKWCVKKITINTSEL